MSSAKPIIDPNSYQVTPVLNEKNSRPWGGFLFTKKTKIYATRCVGTLWRKKISAALIDEKMVSLTFSVDYFAKILS